MRAHVRLSRLLISFLAGLLLVGAAVAPPASAGGGYRPQYREVGCDGPQFAGRLPTDMEIECGLLTVKENRLEQLTEGNRVVLPVAIIKSAAAKAKADPVVMLNGGPGGGAFEYFTVTDDVGTVVGFADHVMALAQSRDIILMDQRGAGRAEPSTDCPEYSTLVSLQQLLVLPGRAGCGEGDAPRQPRTVCREPARRWCRPQPVRHPNLAQDLRDLRRALGIKKWNVYGHS